MNRSKPGSSTKKENWGPARHRGCQRGAEPLGVGHVPRVCPICKSPAQELPHTGHATGFECPTHDKFKVADTILAEECTRQRWEAALRKAKLRAKPWEVPTVMSEDLFWRPSE